MGLSNLGNFSTGDLNRSSWVKGDAAAFASTGYYKGSANDFADAQDNRGDSTVVDDERKEPFNVAGEYLRGR